MNMAQVELLLGAIKSARGIDDFVVMGSISVLGMMLGHDIPEGMILSNDTMRIPALIPVARARSPRPGVRALHSSENMLLFRCRLAKPANAASRLAGSTHCASIAGRR